MVDNFWYDEHGNSGYVPDGPPYQGLIDEHTHCVTEKGAEVLRDRGYQFPYQAETSPGLGTIVYVCAMITMIALALYILPKVW